MNTKTIYVSDLKEAIEMATPLFNDGEEFVLAKRRATADDGTEYQAFLLHRSGLVNLGVNSDISGLEKGKKDLLNYFAKHKSTD